jgi:hypothetical protein
MARRREFLALLAALIASFHRVRVSQAANRKSADVGGKSRLVLHKGWLLRSDDPRDTENQF